jgi:hypothetical protein
MTSSQINTLIGGAAFLLALHLTPTSVLCYLIGALITAAILLDRKGGC